MLRPHSLMSAALAGIILLSAQNVPSAEARDHGRGRGGGRARHGESYQSREKKGDQGGYRGADRSRDDHRSVRESRRSRGDRGRHYGESWRPRVERFVYRPRVIHPNHHRVIVHHTWRVDRDWDDCRAPIDAWGDRVYFTVYEPVQLGWAEVICDDGDRQIVDFDGRWFSPGTYALVDFDGGRRVSDVRFKIRTGGRHSDFSFFLALRG